MEDLTRLFVVCGKAAEVLLDHASTASGHCVEGHLQCCVDAVQVDVLTPAFSPFGTVQSVKLVRDKGGIVGAAPLCSTSITACATTAIFGVLVSTRQTCVLCAVAYVKFDKASSAARALEVMHEAVLNEGRGPLLKVFLAEAPSSRYLS